MRNGSIATGANPPRWGGGLRRPMAEGLDPPSEGSGGRIGARSLRGVKRECTAVDALDSTRHFKNMFVNSNQVTSKSRPMQMFARVCN